MSAIDVDVYLFEDAPERLHDEWEYDAPTGGDDIGEDVDWESLEEDHPACRVVDNIDVAVTVGDE